MKLILYDFDGTLTDKDSLFEIARFSTDPLSYWLRLMSLSPLLIAMKLRLVSNQRMKQQFLLRFFGKHTESSFSTLCEDFSTKRIQKLIRQEGLKSILEHRKEKNTIVVVSASLEKWIRPWARQYDISVIATKVKFDKDRLIGIDGLNCNGHEKVRRIRESIRLEDFDKVIAYGDTKGDLPMLALADEKHFKPFR